MGGWGCVCLGVVSVYVIGAYEYSCCVRWYIYIYIWYRTNREWSPDSLLFFFRIAVRCVQTSGGTRETWLAERESPLSCTFLEWSPDTRSLINQVGVG